MESPFVKYVRELNEQAKQSQPSEREQLLSELASMRLDEYPTWSAETHGEWEEPQPSKDRDRSTYNDRPHGWGWVFPNEEDDERRKDFNKYSDYDARYSTYSGSSSKGGCFIM